VAEEPNKQQKISDGIEGQNNLSLDQQVPSTIIAKIEKKDGELKMETTNYNGILDIG
jgi:hypothetical protein